MKRLVKKIIQTNKLSVEQIFAEKGKVYSFLNPVSYIHVRKYRDKYQNVDGLFADGSLLVLFILLFYRTCVTRYSFDMTSLAKMFFEHASANGKSVYFIGAEREYIDIAYETIKNEYPNLNVLEHRNGFFSSDEERSQVIQHIVDLNPDFVIVGMGSVIQDMFLTDLKCAGFKGIGFSCGGFFHQIAQNGSSRFYPSFFNKINMRYLYRMYKEPHTRRRYFKAAFVFPVEFILDLFKK